MKLDDQKQYIAEFKQGLQKRILTAIIAILIVFYFIYLLCNLLMVEAQINNFSNSEFAYLQVIGTSMGENKKYQYQKILNFLDGSRKLLEMGNNNVVNQSVTCNSNIFDCSITNAPNYTAYTVYYPVLASHATSLVSIEQVTSVFLYNSNSNVFFNMTALGWSSSSSLSQFTLQAIEQSFSDNNITMTTDNSSVTSTEMNTYTFANIMLNETNSLSMFCEWVDLSNMATQLCVLFQTTMVGFIPNTSNYYYLTNNFITVGLITPLRLFASILSEQINTNNPDDQEEQNDIFNCLNKFPFLYTGYTNAQSGLVVRCQSEGVQQQQLNYFGPYYSFKYYSNSIGTGVAPQDQNSLYINKQQSYSFFICSNNSYYSFINQKINNNIQSIRSTTYCLLGILALLLWILVRWMDAMESSLIPSINFVMKLSELVKGKQEKEFLKLADNYKPDNLSFLVNSFKQYLWVCRLLRMKGRQKHKKLLLQGLVLFSEDHYVPILQYIYSELIVLQLAKIDNLLRIKNLPRKKNDQRSRNDESQPDKAQSLIPPPPSTPPQSLALPAQLEPQKRSVNSNKRRNANIRLLDPDDDQLMKNISMSYRLNQGVRFCNDIQMTEVDQGPIIRKIKFADTLISCETIKNDLSEVDDSLKRSENKQSFKSLKDEDESYTSLAELGRGIRKKQSSLKNRSLESIHGDLNNIKFDEEGDNPDDNFDLEQDENEEYSMSGQAILAEIRLTYQSVIHYFEEAVHLRMKRLTHEQDEELVQLVNDIYGLTIQKYQQMYKMLVYENEHQLEIGEERDHFADFQDMAMLQLSYLHQLRHELVQHGEVLRLQIQHALGLPVSFKNLQFLNKSKQSLIKIESRQLLAEAAQQYQPHLDWVVVLNSYLNLKEEKTTIGLKGRALRVLSDNLERYPDFADEVGQLRMVRQFYNPKNKKFYFLTSISSLKPFNSLLLRFFELINKFDIINIYNLQQGESWEPQDIEGQINTPKKKKRVAIDHLKYLLDLQTFLELFCEGQKDKESQDKATSVKTISRRLIYEKEFHEILGMVEDDQVQFSKYIVLLLGEEQAQQSGETEDSSSNTNNRPYQQRIHQQITKIINQGYFHIILIGHQLNAYPSRYGRLKRYVKLSPELLEVDLADKDQQDNLKLLQKFLR